MTWLSAASLAQVSSQKVHKLKSVMFRFPDAQGEVCIKGPAVTRGYYKRDNLNKDKMIFTEDGWLRKGDVGQWNPDGMLSVIDQ